MYASHFSLYNVSVLLLLTQSLELWSNFQYERAVSVQISSHRRCSVSGKGTRPDREQKKSVFIVSHSVKIAIAVSFYYRYGHPLTQLHSSTGNNLLLPNAFTSVAKDTGSFFSKSWLSKEELGGSRCQNRREHSYRLESTGSYEGSKLLFE